METTEQVIISDAEAETLRQARVVLKEIEERMWRGDDLRRNGLALGSARNAERALFDVLNIMRAYLHVPLTDAQVML